jgi:hypothetical protein
MSETRQQEAAAAGRETEHRGGGAMAEMAETTERASAGEAPAFRWIVAIVLFVAVVAAFFDRISIAVLFTNTDFQNAIGIGFNMPLLGLLMTAFFSPMGFRVCC